ncbi:MAG: hypothetical protein MUC49_02110 [Raineya sp.]|jgi:hypothetical protein|nr:hypothetical protein [Raineya sp.]
METPGTKLIDALKQLQEALNSKNEANYQLTKEEIKEVNKLIFNAPIKYFIRCYSVGSMVIDGISFLKDYGDHITRKAERAKRREERKNNQETETN